MPKLFASVFAFLTLFPSIATLAQGSAKKADAATGAVAGSVTCSDTNAPARFAVVTLEPVPPEMGESVKKEHDVFSMNATATTDMDGRFVLDKVPAGRYYVLGSLAGYLNPLARFSQQQLQKMSDETRKELARTVVVVSVEANQTAAVSLRLEHAAEVSGAVLYDDGSPAVGLDVRLLHKDKDGVLRELNMPAMNGLGLFGSTTTTDDRGHYRMIGVPMGEYSVRATLPMQRVSLGGLLEGRTSITVVGNDDSGLDVYFGDTFRKKDAKIAKVGEGEQVGGLDITIATNGLRILRGTVAAKQDGRALGQAHVELLYANDREVVRSVDVHDESGDFEFSYVPDGQYILRLSNAADVEKVEHHEFNSNWTEDKAIRKYGEMELPVMVQGDVSDVELDAPDVAPVKVVQ